MASVAKTLVVEEITIISTPFNPEFKGYKNMSIVVINTTNTPKTLHSHDGDSVIVHPKRQITVDDQFDWLLPDGVRIVRRDDDKHIHTKEKALAARARVSEQAASPVVETSVNVGDVEPVAFSEHD
jgi:hypothetical protein